VRVKEIHHDHDHLFALRAQARRHSPPLTTAIIHLYLGLSFGDPVFVLNGLGYLALFAALYLPIAQLAQYRNTA
jgi:hypothetical protein